MEIILFALSGEKRLATVFAINVIKNGVGDFKVLYRQNGKSFKKTSTENTLDLLLYKTECISLTEHTCSSNTGERSLPFTYRNLSKFRYFYSLNGKSHKKVDFRVGTPLALPLIDGRLR